jgi:LysR family transcriptional regulator, regulator for bpeEF and oprC
MVRSALHNDASRTIARLPGDAVDKLRTIAYFLKVAESHSFARAAAGVHLSPSAVGRAIAALEHEIGFALFNRSTRQLVLTDEGAAYYECCRRLVADLEEVELAATAGKVQARGRLRVGTHPALYSTLIAGMRGFLDAHPELTLELSAVNASAAVLDQGLDTVIRIGPLADSTLVARPLGCAHFVVVAAPEYLAAHDTPRQPSDLALHRAIVYSRTDEEPGNVWKFVRGHERVEVPVPVRFVSTDGRGVVSGAVAGIGISRPYAIAANAYIASGALVPLLTDWHSNAHEVNAVYARRHVPAKVRSFLDQAQQLLGEAGIEAR